METLKVKTNLHCQNCVENVSESFDQANKIKSWKVDLSDDIKTLEATGEGITTEYLNSILNKSGYAVIEGEVEKKSAKGFWSDRGAWKRANFNTLNCLIGCAIGDFGMIFYLQAYHPETSLMLQMTLAIIAGLCTSILLETLIMRFRESFSWWAALKTALGMSFISMVAMEIAMTSTDFMITGGEAAFSDPVYWLALIPALLVGFITPLPYNYWRLKKFNQACH
ncbi:MAG: DUF4396 domain-containing protein [Cyclobacteriaceae bacterium]